MSGDTHGARLSAFTWGSYAAGLGVALLLVPGTVLDVLAIDDPAGVWTRVAGLMLGAMGILYLGAAVHRARWLYWYSVPVRIVSGLTLGFLALTEDVWQLLLLGAVDIVGAGWTFAALRWKPAPEPLEPTAGD